MSVSFCRFPKSKGATVSCNAKVQKIIDGVGLCLTHAKSCLGIPNNRKLTDEQHISITYENILAQFGTTVTQLAHVKSGISVFGLGHLSDGNNITISEHGGAIIVDQEYQESFMFHINSPVSISTDRNFVVFRRTLLGYVLDGMVRAIFSSNPTTPQCWIQMIKLSETESRLVVKLNVRSHLIPEIITAQSGELVRVRTELTTEIRGHEITKQILTITQHDYAEELVAHDLTRQELVQEKAEHIKTRQELSQEIGKITLEMGNFRREILDKLSKTN